MKKKCFKTILLLSSITFMVSCSSDSDCKECHIAWMNESNEEVEVEIGEFCGSELDDVEDLSYTHTLDEAVIIGNDTVPAGPYSTIHCEEHAH
jgi:hypothetical protein